MFSKKEIWKEIRPKLPEWLDTGDREELNKEIGDYIVTSMLDVLGDGDSPVAGAGHFHKLSKEYADEEKGGDTNPNMELNGDMLSALTFEADAYSVKVGFWDDTEAAKAYGHTTGFKGHPTLEGKAPQRKIIPDAKENFISDIQDGIDAIIEEFLSARKDSEEAQSS
jgi:hypothetical protein